MNRYNIKPELPNIDQVIKIGPSPTAKLRRLVLNVTQNINKI